MGKDFNNIYEISIVTGVIETQSINVDKSYIRSTEDYSDILNQYHLPHIKTGYYFQVGEIPWVQGWILDISVIPTQFTELLHAIIPLLTQEKVAFKIARNAEKARSLANGEYSSSSLGKLLCVYPASGQECKLAQILIRLTTAFKGPRVLTDRQLGKVVYTRYGEGNPIIQINENSIAEKFIYNAKGNLIRDPLAIPFQLPVDIEWPFKSITQAKESKRESVLQDKYRPYSMLKNDVKGTVRKGLLLEKGWRVKWCVIKEGKQHMVSDTKGRDIADRLRWQYELQKDLEGVIPIPKVYDLFEENGDTYIVMEYIKGISMDAIIKETFNGKSWFELPLAARHQLLDFATQIFIIVEKIHSKGYIHRDITPANFLVTKNRQLWMIDLELSYSEKSQKPFPPFRLGTPGFISPEQEDSRRPAVEQDIYALGGVLIYVLTGLFPTKFPVENLDSLQEQLVFFIPNLGLVEIICACLNKGPDQRPDLKSIQKGVEAFRTLQTGEKDKSTLHGRNITAPDKNKLETLIQKAINGLGSPGMMSHDNLWISKTNSTEDLNPAQIGSVSVYTGLYQGLSGVLWLLTRAFKLGFSSHACKEACTSSLAYIHKYCKEHLSEIPAGLYFGTAGISLSLTEGIETGFIEHSLKNIELVKTCLQRENILGVGIAQGLAGQGIALLKLAQSTGNAFVQPQLKKNIEEILIRQKKDGTWITAIDRRNKPLVLTGFSYGMAGIICFLLEYIKKYPNEDHSQIIVAVTKAFTWLLNKANLKPGRWLWPVNNKTKYYSADLQEGNAGIILSLIKGYEVLKNQQYRDLAEIGLGRYPRYSIHEDLTIAAGLVGFGETCLEAAKIFHAPEWQERANWVSQLLMHRYQQLGEESCYWLVDNTLSFTADLMVGNSGIIHFLLRCYKVDQLSHPFLID